MSDDAHTIQHFINARLNAIATKLFGMTFAEAQEKGVCIVCKKQVKSYAVPEAALCEECAKGEEHGDVYV